MAGGGWLLKNIFGEGPSNYFSLFPSAPIGKTINGRPVNEQNNYFHSVRNNQLLGRFLSHLSKMDTLHEKTFK